MIRTTGTLEQYRPVEKINEGLYIIRWDLQPLRKPVLAYNEEKGMKWPTGEYRDTGRYSWMAEYVYRRPTLKIVQDVVLGWYNGQVDGSILKGFIWRGMPVWLSFENQFNYKAAYDLAVQTSGGNLPVVFKFGDSASPVYHEFASVEELSEFYLQAMAHINACLKEGWKRKDGIDWSAYVIGEEADAMTGETVKASEKAG